MNIPNRCDEVAPNLKTKTEKATVIIERTAERYITVCQEQEM